MELDTQLLMSEIRILLASKQRMPLKGVLLEYMQKVLVDMQGVLVDMQGIRVEINGLQVDMRVLWVDIEMLQVDKLVQVKMVEVVQSGVCVPSLQKQRKLYTSRPM